jgi:hypothetical protein
MCVCVCVYLSILTFLWTPTAALTPLISVYSVWFHAPSTPQNDQIRMHARVYRGAGLCLSLVCCMFQVLDCEYVRRMYVWVYMGVHTAVLIYINFFVCCIFKVLSIEYVRTCVYVHMRGHTTALISIYRACLRYILGVPHHQYVRMHMQTCGYTQGCIP